MFYSKKILNKNVYCSDMIKTEHFFTSRDLIVKDNLSEIAKYLQIDLSNLIKPNQTHSDNIAVIEEGQKIYENTDALILSIKNYAIYLNFADCVPVVLYDFKKNISAIAHAGWRGTAQNIASKTVLKMQREFHSNPKDIVAVIGPCISFEYFETYEEALEQLKNSVKKKDNLFRGNCADLKGINKQQLLEVGVEKIDVCHFCTVKDNDKFFSYRKENATKNRHSAIIKIN